LRCPGRPVLCIFFLFFFSSPCFFPDRPLCYFLLRLTFVLIASSSAPFWRIEPFLTTPTSSVPRPKDDLPAHPCLFSVAPASSRPLLPAVSAGHCYPTPFFSFRSAHFFFFSFFRRGSTVSFFNVLFFPGRRPAGLFRRRRHGLSPRGKALFSSLPPIDSFTSFAPSSGLRAWPLSPLFFFFLRDERVFLFPRPPRLSWSYRRADHRQSLIFF